MADMASGTVVHMGGKHRRRWKFRLKLRYLFIVSFVLWGSYVYCFVQQPLFQAQGKTYDRLNLELRLAQKQSKNLAEQIVALHSYAYIADVAVQKYHLISPGEILFMKNNAQASPKSSS